MPVHVLIVGHDPFSLEPLRQEFETQGFKSSLSDSVESARADIANRLTDLVLIGPQLPLSLCISICSMLKERRGQRSVGIIAIRESATSEERIAALEAGADDVVTTPYSMAELLARIGAVLRRSASPRMAHILRFGDITLDRESRRVTRGKRSVDLNQREFQLLETFLENPGRVLSRVQLVNSVWGFDSDIDDRAVVVHIVNLRRALSAGSEIDPIRTVRGMGYVLGGL